MVKISVVINTLNEEKNLARVLSSVRNFADEIVVVDMKSDDNTVEIAKRFGANVYEHVRTGYVEPARNYAIAKATGKWILILDADEELQNSLKLKLKQIVNKPSADYFRIARKNIIFGKWMKHSRWWPDYNIRFFKKGHVSWSEIIHSVPTTTGLGADLEAGEELALLHHHYETVDQYLERAARYTTAQANDLTASGYKFNWEDLIKKPTGEFLSRYFQGEGFKDGLHGFTLAVLQAVSEFIKYLKVWQIEKFSSEKVGIKKMIKSMKEAEDELRYWENDVLFNKTGELKYRIKRKFRLP